MEFEVGLWAGSAFLPFWKPYITIGKYVENWAQFSLLLLFLSLSPSSWTPSPSPTSHLNQKPEYWCALQLSRNQRGSLCTYTFIRSFSDKKNVWGLPWQSSGWDFKLPLQGAWVWFVAGELRSRMPCGETRNKTGTEALKPSVPQYYTTGTCIIPRWIPLCHPSRNWERENQHSIMFIA